MQSHKVKQVFSVFAAAIMFIGGAGMSRAAGGDVSVPVSMTVTANVAASKRMPEISRDDVVVRQGKSRVQVTGWEPARGNRAGLELFILIDDASDPQLSLHYDDLRTFIMSQPASTLVGVGYMRNARVQIAQDLTANHQLAAQALRIPLRYPGAYASPYLSVTDLMRRWAVDQNRREVLMFTSGIGRERHRAFWHRGYQNDADVDTAIAVAQRTGTNIFSIYTPASLLNRQRYWDGMNGQMNMSRLSDSTGGTAFYLGLHSPVTIQPYLSELQRMFNNQYILSFTAKGGKKSGLQPVKLSTEVAGVDFAAHDAVWVAGEK